MNRGDFVATKSRPSGPITVVAFCFAATCSYISGEVCGLWTMVLKPTVCHVVFFKPDVTIFDNSVELARMMLPSQR